MPCLAVLSRLRLLCDRLTNAWNALECWWILESFSESHEKGVKTSQSSFRWIVWSSFSVFPFADRSFLGVRGYALATGLGYSCFSENGTN